MWIFYSRIQNFQSRFSRGNKSHGLHCLVHSIFAPNHLIKYIFSPQTTPTCSPWSHLTLLPMQISALSDSLSSTSSKILAFVSPFLKQSLPLPHLSPNLPPPGWKSALDKKSNCYGCFHFALSHKKIPQLLGTVSLREKEEILSIKTSSVIENLERMILAI